MVTIVSKTPDILGAKDISRVNKDIVEYMGKSTDTKPTDMIVTGSVFWEIDTGDLYLYDEEGNAWIKQFNIRRGS